MARVFDVIEYPDEMHDELVHRFLRKIPAPDKPLETHVSIAEKS